MTEITHQQDPETGHMRQVVTPERLREVLVEQGETLDPPSDFGSNDEWNVGSAP